MQPPIKQLVGSLPERLVQYRNRAEELRVIAEDMLVPVARETLMRIATDYDNMADRLSAQYEHG